MKKHTLFLLILAFVFGFLNVNSANAAGPYNDYLPGCTSASQAYSVTTGKPCGTADTVVDCLNGDLFSSATGKSCTVWHDASSVNTEFKIGDSGDNVKSLQQMLVNTGLMIGKVDGKYGPITNEAALRYYKKYPFPTRPPIISGVNGPIISGVSGPQSLDINYQGTWTVTASSPSGGNLAYSVVWGDEFDKLYAYQSAGRTTINMQDATFSHMYVQAGIYKPIFTVTNSSGQSAQTSLSVNVGGVINTNSINVLSPNGGEAWPKGSTQTINWQDNTSWPPCAVVVVGCGTRPQRLYDINLISYYPPCGYVGPCPAYVYWGPYTIASNVSGSSYAWTIPNCTANNPCSSNFSIPAGSYQVQVCESGTSVCDSSDSYFKIVSGVTTTTSY